jgi:hypothetical protein
MKIIGANITGSFILNSQDVTTTIQTSNVWSGSVATDITALNAATASLNRATASLLNYTASNNAAISDILLETASFNAFSSSILNYTSSTTTAIADILLETASFNLLTASLLSYTASQNSRNGTYATTGSNTFAGIQTVNSNLVVTGSITAQTLIVQTITSSQDFVTGSTKFGSLAINTHQFTGSVIVTGSLNATAFTGSGAGLTSIPNAALTNSTISGIALGSNLATLTIGTGLSGTSYNGSGAVTIANTGVTSNVAGTGITVSGATGAVTITNSGVTSIVAGTGISINQGTGAVTVTNTITNNNQLTNGAGYITSAGTAAAAGLVNATSGGAIQTWDIRTIAPNSMTTGRLGFGFTSWANNNSAPYADFLHLRSYSDGSGGADNLVMFLKSGIGMRIYQQSFGSGTAYSSFVDVLHSSNFSSYALPLSGGTLSGGLSGTTATFTGNVTVSSGNATGGGIILADDGDIVDLNDAYCSMRFSSGVRIFSANRGGSAVIKLGNGGDIVASSDITAYGSPSDISLKENIKPLDNSLSKVLKLQGVTFDWKEDSETRQYTNLKEDIGFIAQQVQEVIPELVRKNNNGLLSLRDRGLTALLVEAIKEQQTQIEELKSIINGLTK